MHIAVVAMDTRGGVQPYAALALGLQHAGHDVRMIAPRDTAAGLRARGLDVVPISAGDRAAAQRAGVAELGLLARTRLMRRRAADDGARTAREMLDGCKGADLLTGGVGGMVVGSAVAEKLGVPFLPAHLQPLGPPTSAFPGVLLPHVPAWLGAPGRRASHRLGPPVLNLAFRPATGAARAHLGLPARPPRAGDPPTTPSVYGFSTVVVPHPPEWGPELHITGYWFLPAAPDRSPPRELTGFLDAGAPPVCIGFGSMTGRDPRALTALVLEATRRAGVRAVLLSGWGALAPVDHGLQPDVLVLDEAPHDRLFPHCAAVVHHGGAGTTAAALRAGTPSVVVPFGVDQAFWGSRVAALDVGPPPVPRRRLTAEALGNAITAVVADHALRRRASAVGERLRAEDGVARAVEVYDGVARQLAGTR